ncbi:helix-turn-helix transcriptional regulator [Enterobacter roggenkampii]|uniref:helix-turn-helix domain-containing protein n=1 Tax=Enterobacter roggenkampii TaxID=1812935 RepID=UPI00254A4D9D|nr:helix-turn-helix transcriptional regulator [Enterobacter roggenkampii]MDK9943645.1 helix-turn-helix transcriptional regulator [Enterobacter roggenkampii]MDK9948172.1 helix-turn-helix transcriptional regulator [Enterobacter roggenkampii]
MQSTLRNLRKSQGLTLSHVANVVDIDPANLSRIERGQQIASLDVAERLVKFYSGQIDELQILYPHRYTQATETGAASVPQEKGENRG